MNVISFILICILSIWLVVLCVKLYFAYKVKRLNDIERILAKSKEAVIDGQKTQMISNIRQILGKEKEEKESFLTRVKKFFSLNKKEIKKEDEQKTNDTINSVNLPSNSI